MSHEKLLIYASRWGIYSHYHKILILRYNLFCDFLMRRFAPIEILLFQLAE
jgi:hypothetical protein